MPSVPPARRRPLLLIGVGLVGLLGVVLLLERGSGELPRSPTCDDVEPGGTRLRSVLPPGAPEAPPGSPAQDQEEVEAAFRPASAEAVYCEDLADPYVLSVDRPIGQRLFVYGTQTAAANLPVLTSRGVLRSEEIGDALPQLPPWSTPGGVWAPAVHRVDGRLLLYYTTTDAASGLQCISVAVADDPQGPFVDRSTQPLVCPVDLGGAIDPSPFVDTDGTAYLLWKNDGNCCGVLTRIFSQALSEDGLTLTGPPAELLASDQPWEGSVIEAPAMVEHEGSYYLFYSGNAWNTSDYAIGYAACAGVQSPCVKPLGQPWLASSEGVAGPGGLELFRNGDGELRAVFHGWAGPVGYDDGGVRSLFTVGVGFVAGSPITIE
jgi:hypothetical protein